MATQRESGYDPTYDIGNKGFLTKFERQLKELDDDVEVFGVDNGDYELSSSDANANQRRLQQRRFSTSGVNIDSRRRGRGLEEEADLEHQGARRDSMGMSDSEHNYHNYLAKVQREFNEVDLEQKMTGIYRDNNSNEGSGTISTVVLPHTAPLGSSKGRASICTSKLTASFSSSKNVIIMGLIAFHMLTSLVMLCAVWKKLTDVIPSGAFASDYTTTVGYGRAVDLLMVNPPNKSHSGSILGKGGGDFLYACVEIQAAVDLWYWTKNGVTTNVALVAAGREDGHSRSELGVQLTFQGAHQNDTHACLPTLDKHQTLCIDWMKDSCGGGFISIPEGDDDDDNDEWNSARDVNFDAIDGEFGNSRDLFWGLLKEKATNVGGGSEYSRRNDCDHLYGTGCHRRVSIVFVGSLGI